MSCFRAIIHCIKCVNEKRFRVLVVVAVIVLLLAKESRTLRRNFSVKNDQISGGKAVVMRKS